MTQVRRFMIVDSDLQQARQFVAQLQAGFPGAIITHERDARTALFKMQNVPYHALITIAGELEKNVTGLQLVNSVLQDPVIEAGMIVLTETSISESYSQQVLRGRINIISSPALPAAFAKAVALALSYREQSQDETFQLHSLAPGEILFFEGDEAKLAYLVRSGLLRATRSRNGATEVLGEIKPGEFVGEMAHLNGDLRSASVIALEKCELIRIPLNVFESLLFTKPNWSMAVVRTLSRRLKTANGL